MGEEHIVRLCTGERREGAGGLGCIDAMSAGGRRATRLGQGAVFR